VNKGAIRQDLTDSKQYGRMLRNQQNRSH
jgi:hypothetical protein